ncbi:nucleotide exchange factor GrpE [Aneurinibacillus tyrosinisolvens]|uniref:nucleotide exchange factor GrpE n=1 Tax=Aneurinibacillus tyrosinisolvens TaxID=1443435 RepID=UPI00063F202C|nr:nucleotide exchange factor GrpE [Aneurinibacillus tyrosinisolvens]
MGLWGFFGRKKENEQIYDVLQQFEQRMLRQISEAYTNTSTSVNELSQQVQEIREQITKLTRMQYKATQTVQEQLEQMAANVETVRQIQAGAQAQQVHALLEQNIRWLDDIDQLCAHLQGEQENKWGPTLRVWAEKLLSVLAENGIYEIEVRGKAFNPQFAESLGTRALEEIDVSETSPVPYQVTEVIRRGFADRDGRVLRKAQVITLASGQ